MMKQHPSSVSSSSLSTHFPLLATILLLPFNHLISTSAFTTQSCFHNPTTTTTTTIRRNLSTTNPAISLETSSFWTHPKSKDEIIKHISQTLFVSREEIHVLVEEPPLIVIDNFLDDEFCTQIIDAAISSENLQRSTTGTNQEMSDIRTSETTWLKESSCIIPLRRLAHLVSLFLSLPPQNMENLQVIRYTPGQKFDVHTDHLQEFNDLDCRGRLATCLVYLNDDFRDGETYFPEYDLKVKPRKGSALFFWNTLERPGMEEYCVDRLSVDLRMRHAGLEVGEGMKWACNRWVHPVDYGAGVRGWG